MKRRFFALLFCLVMLAAILSVTVYADDNTVYIDAITITGLEQPYGGDPMDETYTVEETEYMDDTGIIWFDIDKNKYVQEDYITGHQYYANVWVSLKSGYAFSSDAKVCVDGTWYTPTLNQGDVVEIKVTFAVCQDRPHTHTTSSWKSDSDGHYKVCTGCGEELERADHKGGKATCEAKGKCSVCSYAYIDKLAHTPGPAATETNPQKCTACGYVIAPATATKHPHKLTAVAEVASTCTQPGEVAHYVCGSCNLKFHDVDGMRKATDNELKIVALGHQASDEWEFDGNTHWHSCAVCNDKLTQTEAEHEAQDGKCIVCAGDVSVVEQTTPETTAPQEKPEETKGNGMPWWVVVIIAGGIVVVGAAGCLLQFKRK